MSVTLVESKSTCALEVVNANNESKIYCNATIEEDFDDGTVILVMDKYTGGINKQHQPSVFGDVPIKSITDITHITGDAKNKVYLNKEGFRQLLKIELKEKSKENVLSAIKKLEKVKGVLSVGPDYYLNNWFSEIPATSGTSYDLQWGLTGIDAELAWNITTGSSLIRVGVLDSGIANHSDLNANVSVGWDFENNNALTNDDSLGHGTHVAGIIGATGQNTNGVVGVCPNVQLVPMQIGVVDSQILLSTIASSIVWATNNDIDIINCSGEDQTTSTQLYYAIAGYGGLFVCSAGNGTDNDNIAVNADINRHYPSDYSRGQSFSDRTISVGSVANTGTKASYSNYGTNSVSIFAPGNGIYSTCPTSLSSSGYISLNGTSMATPFVSGTAALIYSVYLNSGLQMSRTEIARKAKEAIMKTAVVDVGAPLDGLCVSNGRLNAYRAVSYIYNELNTPFIASVSNGNAMITGIEDSFSLAGCLSIPNTVNMDGINCPVRQIDAGAFAGQTAFTGIYIPDSVTSIGENAFGSCTNLERVSFTSDYLNTDVPNHSTSYDNYYYTERSLNVDLVPNTTYTLTFDYDNLSSTDYTNVFTSLGVGDTTFAVDLPVQKAFSSTYGKQKIVFTPTAAQLATSTRLWCRFIRTSTPQTVSVDISNVKLQTGVTYIAQNSFNNCPRLASEDLSYTLIDSNTHYSVSKGNHAPGPVLFIPSSFNGKTVTQIADNGFEEMDNRWLFMQEGLQTINDFAFVYQDNLEKVTIPSSVTTIEDFAFAECIALTNVYFDSEYSITNIGDGAFWSCEKLSTITIPSTVTNIGAYAFLYCEKLGPVLFDSSSELTNIGGGAFQSCSLLYQLEIPASVTSISTDAFRDCSFLTSVNFESGSAITSIGSSAFYNCDSLATIDIPSGLTGIGSNAFYGTNLKSITVPSTVTTINSNAFTNSNKLTIYTAKAKTPTPSGWASDWNASNRPVVWGCTFAGNPSYVKSFTKTIDNPSNANATNGIKEPYRDGYDFGGWYTTSNFSGSPVADITLLSGTTILYARWTQKSCVAEGTLITLADGSQVAVENLTGNENLLVWNMLTGQFDSAPILFIDSDPYRSYEITHLYFSDGTEVKVIDEHGFWDFDLNEYVFLRNDAAQYIGHWFNKQTEDDNGNMIWTAVQLNGVDVYNEYTTAWSPVTYGHLCYYVNGMLSMPGASEGFINIFEVNSTNMSCDSEAMAEDIAAYGLFTYEEFAELIPIPEEIFNAFNGQYLKVSIGKGLIDMDGIAALVDRYSAFFQTESDDLVTDDEIDEDRHDNGNHYGHRNKNNGKGVDDINNGKGKVNKEKV